MLLAARTIRSLTWQFCYQASIREPRRSLCLIQIAVREGFVTFNHFKQFSGLCFLAIVNTGMAAGQLTYSLGTPMTVSGRIEASEGSDLSRLRVQVLPIGSQNVVYETNPNHFGSFEVGTSASGTYELRFVNLQGTVVHSQSLHFPNSQTLIVKIGQAASPGIQLPPISLSRLQHKVPKQAVKEYTAAHQASKRGERNKAILHLQKALEIDPDYFEAHNNLGVQWMREGKAAEALRAFERAIAIDASDPLAETNLAVALLTLGRFAEAEAAARAGLRGDGLSARARLYLALSLLEQNKARKEVLFHLVKASSQLEPARKLLEQLEKEGAK